MNNERYLFRGMTYKGEWVYGIPTFLIQENCDEGIYDGIRTSWEESEDVRPETIGMASPFYGKDKQRIFEGDIVSSITTLKGEVLSHVVKFEKGQFYTGQRPTSDYVWSKYVTIGSIHTIN